MKSKKRRSLWKWLLVGIAVLYLPAFYGIPALRNSVDFLWVWLLYVVYLVVVLFLLGIDKGHSYRSPDRDPDEPGMSSEELEETKRILWSRSRWFW